MKNIYKKYIKVFLKSTYKQEIILRMSQKYRKKFCYMCKTCKRKFENSLDTYLNVFIRNISIDNEIS